MTDDLDDDGMVELEGAPLPFIAMPYIREDKPRESGTLVQSFGIARPSLETPGGRAEERRQAKDPAQFAWDCEMDPDVMVPYLRGVRPRMIADQCRLRLAAYVGMSRAPAVFYTVEKVPEPLYVGDAKGARHALGKVAHVVGSIDWFLCSVVRACVPEAPKGYGDGREATTTDRGGDAEGGA